MSIFGGSKSSSKTSNATTTQNVGFNEVHAPVANIQGNNNTLLDGGAINSAFDFAGSAQGQAFSFAESIAAKSAGQTADAVQKVAEAGRSTAENLTNNGIRAALVALLAMGGFWTVAKVWGK